MDREVLRLLLAQGESVERIGKRFGRHPSTVAYWMRKHGLETPLRDRHAGRGGIERVRLTELVEQGMSIAQIAEEAQCSKATVRYWLRRYGLETLPKARRRTRKTSREESKLESSFTCARHGVTQFILEGRGYYRCKLCRQERVADRRRKVKAILVADAGGGCCICGYNRYLGALEFHHVNPSEKRLELSHKGLSLSLATVLAEAKKCVLVCSNCHAELEGGVLVLPVTVQERLDELRETVRRSPDPG